MTGRLTQRDRVLRKAGARGIAAPDFLLPHLCDGGPPIALLASRIDELRHAGHLIENAGHRNRCRIYRLTREPAPPTTPAAAPERTLLFDDTVGATPARLPFDPFDGQR